LTVIEETTPEPVDPEPVVPEPCPAPENLTVSEITATSAVVSWEGSANSYDVRYGIVPEGTTITQEWLQYDNDNITVDVEWSTPANCTELSYTLTDLASGKNYMVQVRGNNGNEDVSQWEAQTFSTLEDISQPEAINSVIVKPEDGDVWYSLDGRRLNGKPTTKGVYIRPVSGSEQDRSYGKKVVMK
jgi:hypothetical protein